MSLTTCGLVDHVRKHKSDGETIYFLQLVVGDQSLQVVVKDPAMQKDLSRGCFVKVSGKMIDSIGSGQDKELDCTALELFGTCQLQKYPLPKKKLTFEHLRKHQHMRPRTGIHQAVMRLRHHYRRATERFCDSEKTWEIELPSITTNDCEGAGEMFAITGSKKFFGKEAGLTVSRQLMLETYVPMGKVFTRGSCFRGEQSNTSRHLAEFDMFEAEFLGFTLTDLIDYCERHVKFIISYVLEHGRSEFGVIAKFRKDTSLFEKMEKLVSEDFKRMSYTEAIDLMIEHKTEVIEYIEKSMKKSFTDKFIEWGDDMGSTYEKWLVQHFDRPVAVHSYPTGIKSFYMKLSEDGKTVQGCDILVPGIGELIGGSVRESDIFTLLSNTYRKIVPSDKQTEVFKVDDPYKFIRSAERKSVQKKLSDEERTFYKLVSGLDWYFDLRLFGGQRSAGYGMGSERMLMLMTGIKNIRDVVSFHRCPKSCFA
jgi:asparaginyl-tRNA synthetase